LILTVWLSMGFLITGFERLVASGEIYESLFRVQSR